MKPRRTFLLTFVAILASTWLTQAGETSLAQFFPKNDSYSGGAAPYGGMVVSEVDEGKDIVLKNPGDGGMIWWFATHRPLLKADVAGWSSKFIQLELKSESNSDVTFSAAWRGQLDPMELSAESVSNAQQLKSDDWSQVLIPVPDPAGIAADKVTGLLIKVSRSGEFRLKSIKIVDNPNVTAAH